MNRQLKPQIRVKIIVFIGILVFSHASIARENKQDIEDVDLDSLLNTEISAAAKYKQASSAAPTAAKYAQHISEAPASITIITSEDIERHGYRTLEEVFMSVRGFYVSNDRNYSYIGVRGFSRPTDWNNRILLLINGHTVNESVYGSAFFGTEFALSLDSIERIEIVRGPNSALYGTSAMFAVVNIITKNGNALDSARASAMIGSYHRLIGSTAFGKEFGNGLDISFSGLWGDIKGQDHYYEEYDDPSANDGVAEGL